MASCLIGLGSNVGDRPAALDAAVERLSRHPAIRVTAQSPWLETSPVGGPPGQSPYLNGAVVVETSLPPQALLEVLQEIEAQLGRRRQQQRWGPRPIDLDLLLYENLVLCTPALVLPHPRMAWRRFVLQPAALVAGAMIHPTTGWSVARLLAHLDTAAPYVAVTGPIGAGKTQLAKRLAAHMGARLIAEPLDLEQLAVFYADPAGQAWNTELQFLDMRTRLLAADAPPWSAQARTAAGEVPAREQQSPPRPLAISDFWFDQSPAFARVWLSPEQLAAFRRHWEQSRQRVVQPKLTVVLDAPGEDLLRRVRRRGRRCERSLTVEQLERIRQSVLTQAGVADLGPVVRITGGDRNEVFAEALATVESME
jgi:2-amino-4-hydroxy-6-hydroxymethyldihydropteridine diphosphokinase